MCWGSPETVKIRLHRPGAAAQRAEEIAIILDHRYEFYELNETNANVTRLRLCAASFTLLP